MNHLCTGRQPFNGQSIMPLLTAIAIAIDQPEKVRTFDPTLPPAVEDLFDMMLAKRQSSM